MDIKRLEQERDWSRISVLTGFTGLSHWGWHVYYYFFFSTVNDLLSTRILLCLYSFGGFYTCRYRTMSYEKMRVYFNLGLVLYILNEALLLVRNPGMDWLLINFLGIGLIVVSSILRFKDLIGHALLIVTAPVILNLFFNLYEGRIVLHWVLSSTTIFVVIGYLLYSHFFYKDGLITAYLASVQSSKMAALGQMAAGMAHEINNPLSVIKGKSDQLLLRMSENKPIDRDQLRKDLTKISMTVDRIAKIIQSLRSFSRKESADPMTKISLKALIADTIDLCQERLQRKNINLKIDFDTEEQLFGHQSELSQVLLNLISNATDALENVEPKLIEISVRKPPGKIQILVKDSGPPIPSEIRLKLMDPFFTTKAPGKGTGLGLSISRGIMEAHRGSLTLDPSLSYNCFIIELPILDRSSSSQSTSNAA